MSVFPLTETVAGCCFDRQGSCDVWKLQTEQRITHLPEDHFLLQTEEPRASRPTLEPHTVRSLCYLSFPYSAQFFHTNEWI